jgi:GNAT superfamily N-acetyltransferase
MTDAEEYFTGCLQNQLRVNPRMSPAQYTDVAAIQVCLYVHGFTRYCQAMRIAELTGGPAVDTIYQEILEPCFLPTELSSIETVRYLAEAGCGLVWAAFDEQGNVLGCAVGEWDEGSRIMLLAWIAIRPGLRGGGIGGALLDAAQAEWLARYRPCLVLAEVEDPARHSGSEALGNPAARLRFYLRRGARILDLPYFQAGLGPGQPRVPDLLLMVLHADEQFAGPKPDTIDGDVLRKYLELYQRQCEGQVATDEQAERLWLAIDRPGGVPLLLTTPEGPPAP